MSESSNTQYTCSYWYYKKRKIINDHSKRRPKIGFQTQLSLNAGQKYYRMLQGEHSAILSTFIELPFVIKIFVLSILELPLKTGFTVFVDCMQCHGFRFFLLISSLISLCVYFKSFCRSNNGSSLISVYKQTALVICVLTWTMILAHSNRARYNTVLPCSRSQQV